MPNKRWGELWLNDSFRETRLSGTEKETVLRCDQAIYGASSGRTVLFVGRFRFEQQSKRKADPQHCICMHSLRVLVFTQAGMLLASRFQQVKRSIIELLKTLMFD